MSNVQALMLLGRESTGLCKQVFQGGQHERERSAKFVAHVAEKQRLGAVDFRQRLGTFLLVFVSPRIRNTRRDLSGNELEKSSVAHVERTIRIEPKHNDSGESALRLTRHGKENCAFWRTIPRSSWQRSESLREIIDDDGVLAAKQVAHRPCLALFG